MKTIECLTNLAQNNPDIAALWLYGSRARGDHHEHSDYDMAVAYTTWLSDPLERRLRPELLAQAWQDKLELPEDKLSVVDIALVPVPLGVAILADGKLLVDKHPQIRMTQESRITSRWEHDYLNHEQRFG